MKIKASDLQVGDVMPIDVRRRTGTHVTGQGTVTAIMAVTAKTITVHVEYSGQCVAFNGVETRINRYSLGTVLEINKRSEK